MRHPFLLVLLALLASTMLFAPLSLNAKFKRVSVAPFFWNDRNVCTAWSLKDTGRWVTAIHCLGTEILKDEEAEPGEENDVYRIQEIGRAHV